MGNESFIATSFDDTPTKLKLFSTTPGVDFTRVGEREDMVCPAR
jgi:hypothetical protein